MAATAHLVRENFIWRIGAITPSARPDVPFVYAEAPHLMPGDSLRMRLFEVDWDSSEEEHQVGGDAVIQVDTYRIADHVLTVVVYYPGQLDARELYKLILQDRHDIAKALRDGSFWSGYDADNTSTNIGLLNRYRIGDELTREQDMWAYASTWTCTIEESE